MNAATTQPDERMPTHARMLEPVRHLSAATVAATAVFLVSLALYVKTLLPGPSFGDWAEMQFLPSIFGVPHPTGYPLYMLLNQLFSFLPIGTPAWRADLLSAVAGAGASAVAVLIAVRLDLRPIIAAICGLTLAVTGTLWIESTFSEMNSLHLFLSALLIHRALVWRAERRDRDLRLGAAISGLALANHALAISVVPIVVGFVVVDARWQLIRHPLLIVQAALLVLLGVSLYVIIPLRALAGPASVYGSLLTWDGFSSLVTGAMFRRDMHFGTGESLSTAWRAVPDIVAHMEAASSRLFVIAGVVGAAVLFLRDRWAASLFVVLAAVNIYFFADYVGTLDHYLLLSWLLLAVWLGVLADAIVMALERMLGPRIEGVEVLLMILPITIAAANLPTHDQSGNVQGEEFARVVFAQLPPNAVLLTYWDALTNLTYVHCLEGKRPDVSLRAYDPAARVVCDPWDGPLEQVAQTRPVFALQIFDQDIDPLRRNFNLIRGPTLAVPYGQRTPDQQAVLYRLELKTAATAGP
jgi:hypothetical protein